MPATLDRLAADALELTPDERLALAFRILESAEPRPARDADAAWDGEILRRMAEFQPAETLTIPADRVFAELREIAPD